VQALGEAKHLLIRHGGHRGAGGFALRASNLDAFKAAIQAAAQHQADADAGDDALDVDADSPLTSINMSVLKYLHAFAPCGMGNPAPLLLSRGVNVLKRRTVGDGKHFMLDLRDGNVIWQAFAFNRGPDLASVGDRMDLVYSVEKGSHGFGPRLRLHDWKESTGVGAAP
jgi:single-stranded-DNA-specific exonuclease